MDREAGGRCYEMARYRADTALWLLTELPMFRLNVGLARQSCGKTKRGWFAEGTR